MPVLERLRSRIHAFRIFGFTTDPRDLAVADILRHGRIDYRKFVHAIGYRPRNRRLFLQALLHRSYLQFVDSRWASNERLEFLGDAILNFIVADFLFATFPEMEEGNLTKVRSRLVNRRVLAQRARELHLTEFLLLSTSASQSVEGGAESILSDSYESIVGALYLDGGLRVADRFVRRTIFGNPEVLSAALTDDNYKSALLEYVQGRNLGVPRYSVVREDGPEHDRRFTVDVSIGGQVLGSGAGRSKKEAEQSAAAQALEQIRQQKIVQSEQS